MKIKENELLFFIGISIIAIRSIMQSSVIINISDMISNIFLFSAYICFILNILINKINIKELRGIHKFNIYRNAYICFFKIYRFSYISICTYINEKCGNKESYKSSFSYKFNCIIIAYCIVYNLSIIR